LALASRVAGEWMVTATRRKIITVTIEVGKEEGNGKSNKSNVDGKEDDNDKQ
jgi:hypothetical protein